jgi:hypothetical protein
LLINNVNPATITGSGWANSLAQTSVADFIASIVGPATAVGSRVALP